MPRRYATQQEAAQIYHVTDRFIRGKISQGHISGYKLPGSRAIRIDLDEFESLMQKIPTTKPADQA